jgi:hypothetical protein
MTCWQIRRHGLEIWKDGEKVAPDFQTANIQIGPATSREAESRFRGRNAQEASFAKLRGRPKFAIRSGADFLQPQPA